MIDKNKKILLVEDSVYTRDLYEEVLKEAGWTVDTAVDGQEAIVKAEEGGYDLILLDIMMPNMNGLEFLKEYEKKELKKKNKKVTLLTNMAHDPVVQEAIKLGVNGYLIKAELSPDQLVEEVKKLLV